MSSNINETIKEIKWFVPLELSHSSYIYTSLIEFCRFNKINFKISSKNLNYKGQISIENGIKKTSNHVNSKINWVQIKFKNGEIKKLVFDLNDNPYHFGEYALQNTDTYYKRCFQESVVQVFSPEIRSKMKPIGLPFMVRPEQTRDTFKLKSLFYTFKAIEIFKLDRYFIKRIKRFKAKALLNFKGFLDTRKVSDFESFEHSVSANIFYQKRLFEDVQNEDTNNVNQQRVKIIKVFQNNFPTCFYGGLQKNKLSVINYPELISNIEGDQHSFLKAMKKCGICIYTKGLMESPGWTLPEFLSQGKCIVAEPLANKIPNELVNGTHLVYFSNDNELIDICRDLLADAEKRTFLGKNARQYYENYVAPTVFFQNLLNANFE